MSYSRPTVWFMWTIASLFYAYQYILRVMPNIMLDDIMAQFYIDATIFGQFSGVYYIGYSLMHIPIGIMLDRFGPRKVMTGCILLTVIGLAPLIFADKWIYPVMGRVLIGIGSSAAILGTFKIIRMTFSEQRFTRMLSLAVTIGLLGAIYGGAPVSYMCTWWGYQTVIKIFAMMGTGLAGLTYLIVPEIQSEHQSSVFADLKTVFTNFKVMISCFCAGLMVGPLEGFADVWSAGFLKQVYQFDPSVANGLPSLIFIGMCFGAPLLSMLAEKTNTYLGSIIGAGVVMLLCFIALVGEMMDINTMTVSFVLVGICCSYQIIAIYKVSTYVPESVAGLTTAVANMIIMSFGYVFHTIIGVVIEIYGGIHVSRAFIYGVSVVPAALILGILGFSSLSIMDRQKRQILSL